MVIGYRLSDWKEAGIKIPVSITLTKKESHMLLVGKSGSGKSLTSLWHIYNALKTRESSFYIADYKGGQEYHYFQDSVNYASGDNAVELINQFYKFFTLLRQKRYYPQKHYTLFIEEYFGILSYIELNQGKKARTDLMAKVGELLAVSRGYNLGVFIAVQRASAELFSSGSRDNFQIFTSMGRLSKEQRTMLFSGEEFESQNYPAGQGIVLIDGQDGVQEIIVPYITNQDVLCSQILEGLNKQRTLAELIRAIAEG